uniref:Apolipoprotein M n=1 Tax=Seriola dumerili TaxID=41447 RepID=A0A3B4UUU5_SERDU
MSVRFCLALLALSSLTAASDPGCEELIKPLDDGNQLFGKWIFHSGTSDNANSLRDLKTVNSSWIKLSPTPDNDVMTLSWGDKVDGKCHYGSVNFTFSVNSTKVTFSFNSSSHDHVGNYLVTCPECILWTDTSVTVGNGETRKGRNLYLFTKSRKLDVSYLDVFKKQAACLNFQPDIFSLDNTDLCPDEKEPATDVKEDE